MMSTESPLDDALPAEASNTLAHSAVHASPSRDAFFHAWKRCVALASPSLFGDGSGTDLAQASSKWALCPRLPAIHAAIGPMSHGERVFLAALASFYDTEDGGALLRRGGVHGLADLGILDLTRRQLIAQLIIHYTGW